MVGSLLDRPDVLILDTETTRLGRKAEIVEIAIVDTTGATRLSALVMPEGAISSDVSDIHGLTRRRLRELDARPWPEIHDRVCALLASASIIVGWRISIELQMLEQTVGRQGLSLPAVGTPFDMLTFYRQVKGRPRNDMAYVMSVEGLTWEGPIHRAESDCSAVLAIMKKIASEHPA